MFADITTALAGIKTASDLASLILKAKVDSAVREKAIELQSDLISLQSAILSVQAQNQDLLRLNHELEQKIFDIEHWKATAEQYDLTQVARGVYLYTNKKNNDTTEPTHWLCPKCYEDKKKSIIQRESSLGGGTFYICPNCKHQFRFTPGFGITQP